MPLPDPHADEPTVELEGDLWKLWNQARTNAEGWSTEADRIRKRIEERIGDAYAATVDGVKVLTYRPTKKYAEARLRKDYPDLTEHFILVQKVEVLDTDKFAAQHPEIAERYRVRSLRRTGEE